MPLRQKIIVLTKIFASNIKSHERQLGLFRHKPVMAIYQTGNTIKMALE
jgi:hypothetical protein